MYNCFKIFLSLTKISGGNCYSSGNAREVLMGSGQACQGEATAVKVSDLSISNKEKQNHFFLFNNTNFSFFFLSGSFSHHYIQ